MYKKPFHNCVTIGKKNFKDEKVSPSNHLVENAMNLANKFEVKANENAPVHNQIICYCFLIRAILTNMWPILSS